jgi:UDP-N-acetylmuramoyl-tripeptide--D-alanyl-D-alanine ligase
MEMQKFYELFRNATGVSTDTRKINPGNLFVALKGDRFNGNLFAEEALRCGASAVVVDEKHFHENDKIILVEDALRTLQFLANHHRRRLKVKVVAVCGSNGKTTTKELMARVLASSFTTYATKGNLNNHIGVPLSLLELKDDHEFAVIEMGANHWGETKLLCEIAEPDCGLITNNGKDHLEGYGSIEGVRKGNGELYDFLRAKNRTAFVCADQPDLMQMSEGMNRITYGKNTTAVEWGKLIEVYPFLKLETKNAKLETHLIGHYNFDNIMAAVCVGNYFGVPAEKIKKAVESYLPSNNRSQVIQQGTNTFILDAYNANPSSVTAALENFISLPVKNKIVILGDMAELGASSDTEHREIVSKLQTADFKLVVLVGHEFQKADPEQKFHHFENAAALKSWFGVQQFEQCHFLLKASRVIGLEKIMS